MKITCMKLDVGHDDVFIYVLLTVNLSIIVDNDQLDTHFLYFTILLL